MKSRRCPQVSSDETPGTAFIAGRHRVCVTSAPSHIRKQCASSIRTLVSQSASCVRSRHLFHDGSSSGTISEFRTKGRQDIDWEFGHVKRRFSIRIKPHFFRVFGIIAPNTEYSVYRIMVVLTNDWHCNDRRGETTYCI